MVGRAPMNPTQRAANLDSRGSLAEHSAETVQAAQIL